MHLHLGTGSSMRRHASQVGLHFKPISEFLFPEISLCDETPPLYRRFDLECYACGLRCVRMCGEAPSRVRAYDCKPRSALDTQAGTQVQWQCVCDLVCVRFPQVRFPISTAKRDEPVGMPRPCERHTDAFRITRRRTIDHAPLPNMGSAARRSRSRDGEYLLFGITWKNMVDVRLF